MTKPVQLIQDLRDNAARYITCAAVGLTLAAVALAGPTPAVAEHGQLPIQAATMKSAG